MAQSICSILAHVKGEWAIIYWHAGSNTLFFGRDYFGRRSLCIDASNLASYIVVSSACPHPIPAAGTFSEVPATGLYRVTLYDDEQLKIDLFEWTRIQFPSADQTARADDDDDASPSSSTISINAVHPRALTSPITAINTVLPAEQQLTGEHVLPPSLVNAFVHVLEGAVRRRVTMMISDQRHMLTLPQLGVLFSVRRS